MKKILASLVIGTVVLASPASANHIFNLDTPFPTRGECEAERNELSNNDDWLLDVPGQTLFSSPGEVRSFLSRAFTCELNESDGQWYITDHRIEVIESEWFQRRL